MRRAASFSRAMSMAVAVAAAVASGSASRAGIMTAGDVFPYYQYPFPNPWVPNSIIIVGNSAAGVATVNGGSGIISVGAIVGVSPGGAGTVLLSDNGTSWISAADLQVGIAGVGFLNVGTGALLSTPVTRLGSAVGGKGTISLNGDGAICKTFGDLLLGGDATTDAGTGTFIINPGANSRAFVGDLDTNYSFGANWNLVVSDGDASGGNLVVRHGSYLQVSDRTVVGLRPNEHGALLVTGAGSQMNSNLTLGYDGAGTLNVLNGGQLSTNFAYLGEWVGSRAVATLSGASSVWNVHTDLNVGYCGQAGVTISAGGHLNNEYSCWIGRDNRTAAQGTLTVDGKGSVFRVQKALYLGADLDQDDNVVDGGVGTLVLSGSGGRVYVGDMDAATDTISVNQPALFVSAVDPDKGSLWARHGAQVNIAGWAILGYNPGEHGAATLSGASTRWVQTYQELDVGYRGEGTLSILDGASLQGYAILVGNGEDSAGTLVVSGQGSHLETTSWGALYVGYAGSGTFTVADGATVATSYAAIGMSGQGYASLDGPGSRWDAGNLVIGSDANAGLIVAGGAALTANIIQMSQHAWAAGLSLTGRGSSIVTTGTITTGGDGFIFWHGTGGWLHAGGPLEILGDSAVMLDPSGDKVLRVGGLTMAGQGLLDLADNDMIVDYTGPSQLNDIWRYLLNTRAPSGYGLWSSKANTSPNPGESGKTGLGFAEAAALGLTSFDGIPVDATTILVKYTYLGDSNLDGRVDVIDLGALATHWQAASSWIGGDFNYDGFIDVIDLGMLASNWQAGVTNPLGPASIVEALAACGLPATTVPEPLDLWIPTLLAAAGACCLGRRRHNMPSATT